MQVGGSETRGTPRGGKSTTHLRGHLSHSLVLPCSDLAMTPGTLGMHLGTPPASPAPPSPLQRTGQLPQPPECSPSFQLGPPKMKSDKRPPFNPCSRLPRAPTSGRRSQSSQLPLRLHLPAPSPTCTLKPCAVTNPLLGPAVHCTCLSGAWVLNVLTTFLCLKGIQKQIQRHRSCPRSS